MDLVLPSSHFVIYNLHLDGWRHIAIALTDDHMDEKSPSRTGDPRAMGENRAKRSASPSAVFWELRSVWGICTVGRAIYRVAGSGDGQEFASWMAKLSAPGIAEQVAEDEGRFFDRSRTKAYVVQEYATAVSEERA